MASDCKVFLGKKDHLLMSTSTVKAITGGNLSVHMEFPRADRCNQVDAEYLKVGSEGHFRVPALGYLDVRIVDTDYSSFAVVYIYKELEGALSTMVQLYSRTQEASPQAVKAFQDFYPTVGLPDDMMVTLPKSGFGGRISWYWPRGTWRARAAVLSPASSRPTTLPAPMPWATLSSFPSPMGVSWPLPSTQ
uniref:Lipocalin 15 n=1 Tax=Equus caballus TaxID=9796 RepID=A0A9L0RVK0_HORSE